MLYVGLIFSIVAFTMIYSMMDRMKQLEERVDGLEKREEIIEASSGDLKDTKQLDKEKTEKKINDLMDDRYC